MKGARCLSVGDYVFDRRRADERHSGVVTGIHIVGERPVVTVEWRYTEQVSAADVKPFGGKNED